MKSVLRYIIAAWAFLSSSAYSADLRFLEYDGFQLVVDCDIHSAIKSSSSVDPNTCGRCRRSRFSLDSQFALECQKLSGDVYFLNWKKRSFSTEYI